MRTIPSVRAGLVFATSVMLMAFTAPQLAAQTGQVTGRVTNALTGAPLSGAQVVIQGSGTGTLSNVQGRYLLLAVPAGPQVIEVTRLGYGMVTVEVTVLAGETAVVDIEMSEEAIALEEVVVTGTASGARRKEVGNSIGLISEEDILAIPAVSTTDVLQGQTAGLTVRSVGGQPGSGNEIIIRGINTLGNPQSNRPLIYVDGVRLEGGGSGAYPDEAQGQPSVFDDLDPNTIERIEVVKGAAATTLYGTEAAAGVIQIFTKRGGGGAPQWTATIRQGFSDMGHIGPDKDINPTGLGMNDCTAEPNCPASGSWLRKGHIQEYDLSVRGGDQVPWFFSTNFGDTQGNVAPGGQQKMSVRANFRFTPIDNVTIRASNMFSRRDITFIPDGNNAEGMVLNVLRGDRGYTPGNDNSLVLDMALAQQIDHFISGLNITWTPSASLSQRLNVGLDYISSDYTEERPYGYFRVPLGDREADVRLDRNVTVDYAGSFNNDILGLASSLSWGAQYYDQFGWGVNGFGDEFAGPGDKLLQSAVTTDANEQWLRIASGGFFVQEQLGWNDQLFFTVGGRWDGFSTFGENFGLAFYPKASLAYTISDNDWFPGFFDSMKLRAAIGQSGRAPGPFASRRTWASTSGDDQQAAVILAELGNEDVGPERTTELEFGFEGSVMSGRLSFDFTYYDQTTSDALLRLPRPTSLGTEQALLTNLGEVVNSGFEFTANANLYAGENVSWSVGGNFWTGENEVTDLGEFADERLLGRPVDAWFEDVVTNRDAVGVRPEVEEAYLGPIKPTTTWGINTQITVMQRFTIDALGEFQGGHIREAGTARQNVRRSIWPTCQDIIDRVNAEGSTPSGITAGELGKCSPRDALYGEWTTDGDFFRLRSVSLSYRVPDNWLPAGATGLTLRAQGRNLWHTTDFEGLDPEANAYGSAASWNWAPSDYYQLPVPKSFVFSATVNF